MERLGFQASAGGIKRGIRFDGVKYVLGDFALFVAQASSTTGSKEFMGVVAEVEYKPLQSIKKAQPILEVCNLRQLSNPHIVQRPTIVDPHTMLCCRISLQCSKMHSENQRPVQKERCTCCPWYTAALGCRTDSLPSMRLCNFSLCIRQSQDNICNKLDHVTPGWRAAHQGFLNFVHRARKPADPAPKNDIPALKKKATSPSKVKPKFLSNSKIISVCSGPMVHKRPFLWLQILALVAKYPSHAATSRSRLSLLTVPLLMADTLPFSL